MAVFLASILMTAASTIHTMYIIPPCSMGGMMAENRGKHTRYFLEVPHLYIPLTSWQSVVSLMLCNLCVFVAFIYCITHCDTVSMKVTGTSKCLMIIELYNSGTTKW